MSKSNFLSSNSGFSFNLFREAYAESADGAVQVSPFSVRRALTMAALGSRGKTRKSFLDTFELPAGTDLIEVCKDNQSVLKAMLDAEARAKQKTTINVANALWLKKGWPFVPQFKTDNKRYFDATVQTLAFDAKALKKINAWVKEKTIMIDKILDEIPADASAFLTDALYMKTPAQTRFRKKHDLAGKFYKGDGSDIDLTYMVLPWLSTRYLRADDVQVLQYNFGQFGTFNGYLIVPDAGTTVQSVVNKLNGKLWLEWQENLGKGVGRLALAPNEQDFDTDLIDPLSRLGLAPALSDSADFLAMSPIPLKIGAVKHRTKTKWTRKGFEGAAVTAIGMVEAVSVGPEPTPFDITVERPYIWVIEGNGEILFLSSTVEPKVPDTFASETDEDDTF